MDNSCAAAVVVVVAAALRPRGGIHCSSPNLC